MPFDAIREISYSAALLVAAEYDRRRRISGRQLYTYRRDKWAPDVEATLSGIGFLELLNIDKPQPSTDEERSRQRVLRMKSGVGTEPEQAARFQDALRELFGAHLEDEENQRLYECLIEAMNNVDHAYRDFNAPASIKKRWWLTGSFDPNRNLLHVSFLDHGVTIPHALPRSRWKEQMRAFLRDVHNIILLGRRGPDDAERIHAAMEVGRSGTGKAERGHGLAQMRDFVDKAKSGSIRITSRRGTYEYTAGRKVELFNHNAQITGTLIEWDVEVWPCPRHGGENENDQN